MLGKITIQVTKTSDGSSDYVQISSPAAIPVNIVLVADEIVVDDRRAPNSGTLIQSHRSSKEKKP